MTVFAGDVSWNTIATSVPAIAIATTNTLAQLFVRNAASAYIIDNVANRADNSTLSVLARFVANGGQVADRLATSDQSMLFTAARLGANLGG